MQPTITRETVPVERRQPILRWSAVLAGAACSIGFWILLQLLGVGLGLAAVDVDDIRSLRGAGAGTTLWSLVSPLIAMFFGGLIAGHLSQTYDRKLAGTHGLVMWALTSIVGLVATIWIMSMVASGAARPRVNAFDTGSSASWAGDGEPGAIRGLGIDAGELLAPINQRLVAQNKPTITVEELEAAMRGVVRSGIARGNFDQELLVDQLVANTPLSRNDAIEVERQLEARMDAGTPHAIERRAERYVLDTIDNTGKALTTVGLSLLLALISSILGALTALRRLRRDSDDGSRRRVRTTEPGIAAATDPLVPAPPGTPVAPAPVGNGRIIVPPTD